MKADQGVSKLHPLLDDIHSEALSWTNQLLNEQGIKPVSELVVVREMAWSVVARVSHEQGIWYFKYLPDYFLHELAVTEYLSSIEPKHVARFVGVDKSRGYLMVADAGPMLRERFEESLDASMWFEALETYAKLQITTMKQDSLYKLKLPNRSLHRIPELVDPNIDRVILFNGEDEEDQCLPQHVKIVRDALKDWPTLIEPLYRHGIKNSLNHGDFHDGNVAYKDHSIIFDWGDACITHPFMSLRSVFVSIERRFEYSEDSEEFAPFIEAYLTPWLAFASMSELKVMFRQARRVWALVSFLSWSHGIQNQNDPRATQYNYALPALLRECADALINPKLRPEHEGKD